MIKKDNPDGSRNFRFGSRELKLMQRLFEDVPIYICILKGPQHRLQYMNKFFRNLYRNRDYPPGTPARKILMDSKGQLDEVRNRLNLLDHIYSTGKSLTIDEMETYFLHPETGLPEKKYFNLIFKPLRDGDGEEETFGLLIAGYEVTRLVQTRRESTWHEKRLNIALEGAEVGFWEYDFDSQTLDFVSDECKILYGFPPDREYTEADFQNAIHPEDLDHVKNMIRKATGEPGLYEAEYRMYWPDESLHWFLSRGQCTYDENGHPDRLLGITVDITKRKETEHQLKEAVRLRDDFLAIAAHELKTPVTSMKTRVELIERQLRVAGNEDQARQVSNVNRNIDRLTKLTGSLLDISRLQQEGLTLDKHSFSIKKLIEEKVDMLQSVLLHTIEIEGEARSKLYGDRGRIGQVLTNLLENAAKYSPDADRILVRYRQEAGKIIVSVVDFGMGIPKEDQQRVFERFFKGSDGQRKTYPGFGIGLYIARQIVERHGGGIWVEDNPEGGSVFSFSLPVADRQQSGQ